MSGDAKKFDAGAYLDQMLVLRNLQIDPAWRPGIIENIERSYQIAQGFIHFPLPDDVEAGPVFQP